MRFLGDESVDDPIIDLLRKNGYEIDYIKEISPGIDEEALLELAHTNDSILITMDKDFGELVYRKKQAHRGIVLLRLDGFTPKERAALVLVVFDKHLLELSNSFTVIQTNFTRIRPM